MDRWYSTATYEIITYSIPQEKHLLEGPAGRTPGWTLVPCVSGPDWRSVWSRGQSVNVCTNPFDLCFERTRPYFGWLVFKIEVTQVLGINMP